MVLGSKQYTASIAFTLALFSHLVNHVNIRLQAELEEAESQVPQLHTDATGEKEILTSYLKNKFMSISHYIYKISCKIELKLHFKMCISSNGSFWGFFVSHFALGSCKNDVKFRSK